MNSSFLHIFLVFLFSAVFTTIHAGTWLSFNDFKEDGELGAAPSRRINDVVTSCKDTQKRLAKRAYLGERVTRAEQETDAICRILMRMVIFRRFLDKDDNIRPQLDISSHTIYNANVNNARANNNKFQTIPRFRL